MNRYSDIIDHPHYRSKKRPAMSMTNRAAQFSPFAALTGLDDAVCETARLAAEEYTGKSPFDADKDLWDTGDDCDDPC